MVDIFVSYSSEDRERIRPIVAALERHGWSVWWDRQIGAGSAFDREIEKAIDQAACVVVAWSPNSAESEWVRTEANEGLERNCLVPISIEDVKPPLAFRRIQTIDMGDPESQLQLIAAISRFAEPPVSESGDYTPFIGRENEKQQLVDQLQRAGEGEGGFILLSGEAGVGKTRLTLEAAAIAKNMGFLVLSGRCADMDGAAPYQPLLEQIEQTIRLVPHDNLREALGDNAPEVAKLMPELRQIYDDIDDAVTLPPDQERRYLLHGVGEFISRGAEIKPMVLVYEDLHWADDSTCILLRHLSNRFRESKVLIIGTCRDTDLDRGSPFVKLLQDLNRERLITELVLRQFDREGVKAILEGRVRREPPVELIDLVYSETEGNPFFVEELFRHLLDAGKLLTDSGEFLSGIEIADTEVPRSVRLVISERVEKVSDICRQVLTLGAVIGRMFQFDMLLLADAKLDEDDVLDAIDEAEAANLIEDLSKAREARYGFVHEQIRQTLLSSLSFPRRQRMHLRVALGLEKMLGDSAASQAGTIAYHLFQSGSGADEEKTVHYLTLAADRAQDSLAFEDAVRYLDQAITVIQDAGGDNQENLLQRKANALYGSGRVDDAVSVLNQSESLAVEQSERDQIILQKAEMLVGVYRGHECTSELEGLMGRVEKTGNQALELEVSRWLGRAYYQNSLDKPGFTDKTRDAYEHTIQLARELDDQDTLGYTLVQTAQLMDYWPEYYEVALQNLKEAETIASTTGNELIALDAATMRLNTNMYRTSDNFGEVTLERLLKKRDPIRTNALYFRMMWAALGAGRLERCVEICDAGIELAYRIGGLPVQYPSIKSFALMELGTFDDAWAACGEEIADEDHRFGAALQEMVKFQFELNCGDFDAALVRGPDVISESEALSRIWMLGWVANSCAIVQPYLIEQPDKIAEFNQLIESTGMPVRNAGEAALKIASGDFGDGIQILEKRVEREDRGLRVRDDAVTYLYLTLANLQHGNYRTAYEVGKQGITLCERHQLHYRHWQQLSLTALAAEQCGEADAASDMEKARELHAKVGGTVNDEKYQQAFLTGPMAKLHGLT